MLDLDAGTRSWNYKLNFATESLDLRFGEDRNCVIQKTRRGKSGAKEYDTNCKRSKLSEKEEQCTFIVNDFC